MSNDTIEGLQKIREQVFERLLVNPDYRVLRAIDKTISDVAAITDISIQMTALDEQANTRRDATTDGTSAVADLGFSQMRPSPVKLTSAPLFPAHRVA